ncbi:hypothetical protein TWF730_008807 [Orbilia blumenaviensis]|uniref:BTB domain-containing protein n=1 Tax=Orbilia blumenaviensis TaxID=1796055 RepID=A0AAV9V5T7_9PEZI
MPSASEAENVGQRPFKRAKVNVVCIGESEGSLLSLLIDPRFSDVKVIIGQERLQYDLHRAIICSQSTFFSAACKEGFKESNTREIDLPDIESEAFEVVVTWLYHGGYSIKGKVDPKKFCELYQATDFLGVDSLKKAMMSAAARALQEDVYKESYSSPNGPPDHILGEKTIDNPLELIQLLTEYAPCSDWQCLRQVADKAIPHNRLSGPWLRGFAGSDPSEINGFFAAIMLDAYQELMSSVFCGPCTRQFRNGIRKCQNCRKPLPFHKRESAPEKVESPPI